MLICVRSSSEDEKPWQYLLRQYTLQDALEGCAVMPEFYCLFPDDRGNVLMLYDAPKEAEATLREAVHTALGAEIGVTVQIECEPVASLTKLSEAYDAALERLSSHAPRAPAVDAAVKYIEAHYTDPGLGLNEVAGAINIHPTYLSRLMKRELGMPFARYLTHVRILGMGGSNSEELVRHEILDGSILCSTGGREAVDWVIRILSGKQPEEKRVFIIPEIITSATKTQHDIQTTECAM